MDCIETHKKIKAFMDNKMDSRETLDFIQHVQGCKDCMDELSIEYLVVQGLKQLDSDSSEAFNLDEELKDELDMKQKNAKFRLRTVRWIFILSICFAIVAGYMISTLFFY